MTPRVLVTGAGRGIGRAIALRLAADGAAVVCSGRDVEALQATADQVQAAGGTGSVLVLDLEDADAVAALPDTCGPVDGLVANSGIAGPTTPVWELEPADWERTVRVNLTSGYLLARALLPGMIERRHGSLVFVGSVTASRPLPGRAPYAASKSGLTGLVRSLALDAGPFGVRVNLVHPGPTSGDRLDAVLERQADARGRSGEALRAELLAGSPLRRLTEPDDVAEAVAFLAGEGSRGITGAELTVASGAVMA
jgi:NAD(P)-dependent dehydrogenase (short-subunit alcohol dehydrogenase family)